MAISEQARQIAREAAREGFDRNIREKMVGTHFLVTAADAILSALDHQGMLSQPIDHKDDARLATASATAPENLTNAATIASYAREQQMIGYHGNQSLSEASPSTQSEAQKPNSQSPDFLPSEKHEDR